MMISSILLTTPDYPPKLGGLSTFTVTIEQVLKKFDINYDLFVWSSSSDITKHNLKKKYDYIINIHFLAGYFLKGIEGKQINFFHGSEILFYSDNFIKKIYKTVFKRKIIHHLEKSFLNVFISKVTLGLLSQKGFMVDYGRDMIIHNCLQFDKDYIYSNKELGDVLKFVCIARDVPHKNIDGCIDFVNKIAELSGRKVELYVTSNRSSVKGKAKIINISGIPDEHREQVYRDVDFNLLLSLDHSHKGYIEGFGLTVLEAGQYGVPSIVLPNGGLVESVHHKRTGWVINENEVEQWWSELTDEDYSSVCKECYFHTRRSHHYEIYKRFFEVILHAK